MEKRSGEQGQQGRNGQSGWQDVVRTQVQVDNYINFGVGAGAKIIMKGGNNHIESWM